MDRCVGGGSNTVGDIESNSGGRVAYGSNHSSVSSSGSFCITGVGTKFRVASDVGGGSRSSSGSSMNGGRRRQDSIAGSPFHTAVAAVAMRSRQDEWGGV